MTAERRGGKSGDGGPPPAENLRAGTTFGGARLLEATLVGYGTTAVHVKPALLTAGDRQMVAYYGADRYLRVAARRLPAGDWWTTTLDTQIGWDSHNYVALGVDRAGHVHVAGNMHAVPLVYFRSRNPGDCTSLERVPTMVQPELESAVTYPRFVRTHDDQLGFFFRNGASGSGDYELYLYDEKEGQWTRPVTQSLIDGEGTRSSYLDTGAPVRGPDGAFHLVWVWRDSPAAESTHTVCYATSRDLRVWTTSDGTPLELPIRYGAAEVVDPVGPGEGLINNNVRLGFDGQSRPVIAYHRRDSTGRMQLFVARSQGDAGWMVRQVTTWDVRWDFSGMGSLDFNLEIGVPEPVGDGVTFEVRVGDTIGRLTVDADLSNAHLDDVQLPWSPVLAAPGPDGLTVFAVEEPSEGAGAIRRFAVWESTQVRRDQPLAGDEPAPRPIYLLVFEDAAAVSPV